MSDTAIEWTRGPDGRPGKSWNPIRARNKATGGVGHFCVRITEACRYCYAARMQKRFRNKIRYARQDRAKVDLFLDRETLLEPLHWKKPRRIFVCSMTDLFLEDHVDWWIDQVLAIAMLCPQHTFIILTKRGARLLDYFTGHRSPRPPGERSQPMRHSAVQRVQAFAADFVRLGQFQVNGYGPLYPEDWKRARDVLRPFPLPNVQIGVSCHDQNSADEIIPVLLAVPAVFRFASHEPALGPIRWDWIGDRFNAPIDVLRGRTGARERYPDGGHGPMKWTAPGSSPKLDLIIDGGESGRDPKIRPTHPDTFRSNRDQCASAGVAYFHKQNGEWLHMPEIAAAYGPSFHRFPDGTFAQRVGKRVAGRLLDGREHNDLPN